MGKIYTHQTYTLARLEQCTEFLEKSARPVEILLLNLVKGTDTVLSEVPVVLGRVDKKIPNGTEYSDVPVRFLVRFDTKNERVHIVKEEFDLNCTDVNDKNRLYLFEKLLGYDDEELRTIFLPNLLIKRGTTVQKLKDAICTAKILINKAYERTNQTT